MKEMLELLDERGWSHTDKAQLLTFMEGVIHLTEDESSREYEEWETALTQKKEAGRMYVNIMERKGIEKGIVLGRSEGRSEGIILGRSEGIAATARRMLEGGLPVEQIARFTELSYEQIEALRRS